MAIHCRAAKNSLRGTGPNFFLKHFKNNIIFNFVKFVTTKKSMITNFFHLSLLLLFLDPGSEIRDPGSGMGKNQAPGSGSAKHPGSATLLPGLVLPQRPPPPLVEFLP